MGKRSYYCDYSLFACFLCNSQCFNFFEIKLDKLCEIVYNYVCHSQSCPSGRRSMIGNHVYGSPVPRVQIPHSAPLRSSDFKIWDCYFCFTSKGFEPYAMFCGCHDNGVASKISISVATARSIEFCKNKIQIPHSAPLRSSDFKVWDCYFCFTSKGFEPYAMFCKNGIQTAF